MKVAVILYHKNINKIYKSEWIEECIQSIVNQTYKDYFVYDLNYGGDDFNFSSYFDKDCYKFFSENLENHAEAMNYLFDKCIEDDIDCVFNINLDDCYDLNRFDIQLGKIKEGYDIVSSNFKYIGDFKFNGWGGQDEFKYSGENISEKLEFDNIIGHPSVCYSRNFINKNKYIPSEIPKEDWELWKRTSGKFKFYICEEFLLFYRIHSEQITTKSRKLEDIKMALENDKNMLSDLGLSKEFVDKMLSDEETTKTKETTKTIEKILEYVPQVQICKCGGELSITLKTKVIDSVVVKQKSIFCIKCNKVFK
jgi:hypothetical protein